MPRLLAEPGPTPRVDLLQHGCSVTDPSDPALPRVQSSVLDAETLVALFEDLERSAEMLSVLVKARPGTLASTQGCSLARARDLLQQRGALGVQLRYRFQGSLWADTLMVQGDEVRLVRCPLAMDSR